MMHQTANATSLTFSNHPQASAMLVGKGGQPGGQNSRAGANLKSSLQSNNPGINNTSNRRKQRLVSAIPQTAEGR